MIVDEGSMDGTWMYCHRSDTRERDSDEVSIVQGDKVQCAGGEFAIELDSETYDFIDKYKV